MMNELCGLGMRTCERAVVGVFCSQYPRCVGSGLVQLEPSRPIPDKDKRK